VPEVTVREFRTRFVDTKLFYDRFAHGKFARPLFERHERAVDGGGAVDGEDARAIVEEAQLFIDAAHQCQIKVAGQALQPVAQ
jgi:sulfite reductase (ferredoxin)